MARRIVRDVAGGACPSCGIDNPERARFCMSCGAALSTTCPTCETQNPPGAKFCIECGTGLGAGGSRRGGASAGLGAPAAPDPRGGGAGHGLASARRAVRRPAPGRCHAGLGLARRRSAGGAPQGDGAVRRPVRLHGGRRAHGPRGREVDHRPGAAPAGPGGRPLRRLRRQVHRRQRDGGVRCAGRPRGRPRACRPRRPRDAGRDGGDQPGHRAPPPGAASRCGSGSTPARCWPARSATATR